MNKTDPRIIEVLKDMRVNYKSAKWGDFMPEAEVLRVDVLAHSQNRNHPGCAVFLLIDRVVNEVAHTATLEEIQKSVEVHRRSVERYPTLEGEDKFLYFVPK